MKEYSLSHSDKDKITNLLMFQKVTKVSERELELEDGTILTFNDTFGGCSCGAGDYSLTDLNDVDNMITRVEFLDDPDSDYDSGEGVYKIFVYADNKKVNLATWEGSDGNGYYGTGYEIVVTPLGVKW